MNSLSCSRKELSKFESAGLKPGKKPCIELFWKGIPTALSYSYAPLWLDQKLVECPVKKVESHSGKWQVTGEIRIPGGIWRFLDTLIPNGNTLIIDRKWDYKGNRIGYVRLGFDLIIPFEKLSRWAIPYISVNGNKGCTHVPEGMTRNGIPWIFREERTTAPGLIILESGEIVAGTYTEPGKSETTLCSCSMFRSENKKHYISRTLFPFQDHPLTYFGTAFIGGDAEPGVFSWGMGGNGGFIVEGKASFRRKFFVVMEKKGARPHGYIHAWESAWRNLKDKPAEQFPLKQTENLLWHTLDYFWFQKGKACGYSLRINRDGDPLGDFSPNFSIDIGWAAPTSMLTYLGIREAIRRGKPNFADKPIRACNFFVDNASAGNGLFLSNFDIRKLKWAEKPSTAVEMGGGAYWILKCLELVKGSKTFSRSLNQNKWQRFALDFCDLALRTQQADGAFPSRWSLDGKSLGVERSMSLPAALAVLEAYRYTGKKIYLDAAERGAENLIRNCVDTEKYGDSWDVKGNTTENSSGWVSQFLVLLYETTKKTRYLDKAILAAECSLPFVFTYNMFFPSETECGRRKLRTRGCLTISPETAFTCFAAMPQVNAYLGLWEATGDSRWKEYALPMIPASLQMMTEKGDTFGLAPHLIGCRAEVLPVLDTIKGAHFWKRGMTGYTWHEPVWWPAAHNLLSYALIEDRYPQLIKEIGG